MLTALALALVLPVAVTPDVYAFKKSPAAEVHSLAGPTYQQFLLQTATPLSIGSSSWDFCVADYNGDNILDVFAFKKWPVAEVHILAGPSFQGFFLHKPMPISPSAVFWDFGVADHNGDGSPDIYAIKKSSRVEVHVMAGPTYQGFLEHRATPLMVGNAAWTFTVGRFNQDSTPDVFGIKKSPNAEVHVLAGPTYGTFLTQRVTPLAIGTSSWDFGVGDHDLDGIPDLFAIKKVHATEVHVLQGPTYQGFLQQQVTPLRLGSAYWDFAVGGGSSGAPVNAWRAQQPYVDRMLTNSYYAQLPNSRSYFRWPGWQPFPGSAKTSFASTTDCTSVYNSNPPMRECVQFVQRVTGNSGFSTVDWRRDLPLVSGGQIRQDLVSGVILATMDKGATGDRYPQSRSESPHAAVYLRRVDGATIEVADQNFVGDFIVGKHQFIRIGGTGPSDARRYYTIKRPPP